MTEVIKSNQLGGLKLQRAGDIETGFNALIYGDPGIGKTILAASAAVVEELSPVLYIDAEGGTLSIRERYPEVDVIRVNNFNDMNQVYTALLHNEGSYKTVVLDSLTEIQKFGMYEVMRRALEKDPDRDPDLPGIGEWGKNIEQMRKLVRAFRDLPQTALFIALSAEDKDKRGQRTIRPAMSGKLANEVAGFLDIVMYYYRKEVDGEQTRVLLTERTDEVVAKDRTDNLPMVIPNPTMKTIYDFIYTQGTPDE